MDKDYSFTGYFSKLAETAKSLRANMTPQEKHLWYDFLRTYPVHFYKQRVIDRYIVDFYCSAAQLVIEIDGSQHFTDDGIELDKIRTDILGQYGLAVLRFTNSQVDTRFDDVCRRIDTIVQQRIGTS